MVKPCIVTICPNEGKVRIRATIGGWDQEQRTFSVPITVDGWLCEQCAALTRTKMVGIDLHYREANVSLRRDGYSAPLTPPKPDVGSPE